METFPVFSHYCDDEQNKLFTAYSLKDKSSRKYDVPYDTVFLFDSAQVFNQIYFTGGGLPSTESEEQVFFATAARVTIHSTLEVTTEKLPNMLVPRANHTLVSLGNGSVYAVGGCNNEGDTSSCEAFDISKGKWRKCADLTEGKIWVSVCSFNDRYLYAFGGGSSQDTDKYSDSIECLDTFSTSTKVWTRVPLSKGKEYWKKCIFAGVMQIDSESILIFGGHVNKMANSDSFIFHPGTREFTKCGQLAKNEEFYRTKSQILGNELMMVGSTLGDLHIFNITTNTWTILDKNVWNPEVTFNLKSETY